MLADDEKQCCVLPFDAEVFRSTNEKDLYFVVDLARALPPNMFSVVDSVGPLPVSTRSEYLSKLMRKEFVKFYYNKTGKKLSNDAFHPKVRPPDNSEVIEATKFYYNTIPDKVAEHLLELDWSAFNDDLVRIVHFNGLNLRDLGFVHEKLYEIKESIETSMTDKTDEIKKLRCEQWMHRIEIEVSARAFRRVVDSIMFDRVAKGIVTDTEVVIASLFNSVIGCSSEDSVDRIYIWEKINEWKKECFPGETLRHWDSLKLEQKTLFWDKDEDGCLLGKFIEIASDLLGVFWDWKLWEKRWDKKFFQNSETLPFTVDVVDKIVPRVLEMNLANHVRGVVAMDRAKCAVGKDYDKSLHYFKLALNRQPTNEHSIDRYARACKKRAAELDELAASLEKKAIDLEENAEERSKLSEAIEAKRYRTDARNLRAKAEHWIEKACSLPDPHEDTFFSGALLMIRKAHDAFSAEIAESDVEKKEKFKTTKIEYLKKAQEFLEKALHKNKNHRHAGFMLADVMRLLGVPVKDILIYINSHEYMKKTGNNGIYHLFCFYMMERMWKEAILCAIDLKEKIESSERIDKNDKEILANVNIFLKTMEDLTSKL